MSVSYPILNREDAFHGALSCVAGLELRAGEFCFGPPASSSGSPSVAAGPAT
jgi:hypothetical protein